jgi:hypothetical protein
MKIVPLLRELLDEEFQRQGRSGLILWYDDTASLASIVQDAKPIGTNLLYFDGSYLKLRLALERDDPDFLQRWIVYIPEARPAESWLLDWELLGVRWELDLLEFLHRKFNIGITQDLADILRNRPQNARDLVREWATIFGDRNVTEAIVFDALLAVGFGLKQWQINEALLVFLKGDVGKKELESRGLWKIWRKRLIEWTGWTDASDDESILRSQLEAGILLSELTESIPEFGPRFSQLLPSESRRPVVAALARDWRDREYFRDSYIDATRKVEHEYELIDVLTVDERLLRLDTFYVIEELGRREVNNLVGPDGTNLDRKVGRIREIAERRDKLFWGRIGRAPFWRPLELASRLYEGSRKAISEAEALSSIDDFTEKYSAGDGWWRLDLCTLELAASCDALTNRERVAFVDSAFRAYGDYVNRANVMFLALVQRSAWRPETCQFWTRFAVGKGKTAVLFVDALRFDMARRLSSSLPSYEFNVVLTTLKAPVPSVTEIAMSALLPGAEGLEIAIEGSKLHVLLDNQDVSNRTDRLVWLQQHSGRSARFVELDEVEKIDTASVDLLVVTSREVDEFGTFAADLHPKGLLDLLEEISKSIRYLKEHGFERILVSTDHGFLFVPPSVQVNYLDAPRSKICKRRFAVGGISEGCVVKKAHELGFEGEEVFAFPIGLSVFAIQGETGSFLHGGLSLQECLVPILEITGIATGQKISVTMEVPPQLTTRLALVTVRVAGTPKANQARRVFVEINGKQSEIAELTFNHPTQTFYVRWLEFDETPPRNASIRLYDADTLQLMHEEKTMVELVL